MQNFKPSGWKHSPKRPVEKRPRTHRSAWLNTGRASSCHVGVTGLPPSLTPSLSLLCIEHTLLEFTYLGTFLFLLFPSLPKDHSILPMPLQSPPHLLHSASSPFHLSVFLKHTKSRRTTFKPPTPCMWFGWFYYSQCFQQPERTKYFICKIAKEGFFLKMKFLVHYETVLWSIKSYMSVFSICVNVCACVCVGVWDPSCVY